MQEGTSLTRASFLALLLVASIGTTPCWPWLTVASAALANDVGVWKECTAAYFSTARSSSSSSTGAASLALHGSIVALTDWDGNLNPGLLVLARHTVQAENGNGSSKARNTTVVEYYSNEAVSKRNSAFSRKWVSQPLPTSDDDEDVSVVSVSTADLRRTGELDLLLQGSDGHLYLAKRATDGSATPQAPHRLNITAATTTNTGDDRARSGDSSPSFSTKLRYAASPQVSLALLASAYPSIVYVNEDGALIELRWKGRELAAAAAGGGSNDTLDYAYEAYEIVSSSSTAATAAVRDTTDEAALADGRPRGLQRGAKEISASSLALADIDGDCVPELLYSVRDGEHQTFALYAYQPHGLGDAEERAQGRKHVKLFEFSEASGEQLGALTVADVDGDGAVDFVFPWRSPKTAGAAVGGEEGYTGVMVFYSRPFASGGCNGAGDAEDTPSTAMYQYNNAGDALVVLSERYCGPEQHQEDEDEEGGGDAVYITMPDTAALPLIARSGDYNRDGVVDLLVPSAKGPLVLTATGDRGSNVRRTESTGVSGATPAAFTCAYVNKDLAAAITGGDAADSAMAAHYRKAVPFFASLSEEPGRLDVVLTSHRLPSDTGGNVVYSNEDLPDRNYYLLASALNGVRASAESTTPRKESGASRTGGFGVAQPGAVHYIAWEDVHMRTKWRRLTQQSQYVGYALQPPRLLIGLGETFSYVRGFSVGVPASVVTTTTAEGDGRGGGAAGNASTTRRTAYTHQWSSYLVPNSQVFAVLHPIDNPAAWRLQLYLPTSRYKLLIGIALLVWLVALGIPIVLLRWSEMRADLREWKRR